MANRADVSMSTQQANLRIVTKTFLKEIMVAVLNVNYQNLE